MPELGAPDYGLARFLLERGIAAIYLFAFVVALVLWCGSVIVSFYLLGKHFGPAWNEYLLHGPGLRQLGSYVLVTALAIDGDLDSHQLEALQLELRALASSCGLEVTALEVAAPETKAAKQPRKSGLRSSARA